MCIILKGVVRKNNLYNVVRNDIFQNLQKNDTEGQVAKMLSQFEEEKKLPGTTVRKFTKRCVKQQFANKLLRTTICKKKIVQNNNQQSMQWICVDWKFANFVNNRYGRTICKIWKILS